MPTAEMTFRPITIEHVRITSKRPFKQVRAGIEADLPKLDANIKVMLSSGDQEGIKKYEEHGPKLFMFLDRDHGDLLAIVGRSATPSNTRLGIQSPPRR
ncbi:hypothetical protein [Mesorhizobium sp. AR10]|uniref:hypothetical protein n=1 Tax=Mesorhizobium sp. AR10 TaxID=2865839 RepID=UPI00215E22EC|nr:hypothetical protein [Mesorhizobium sp. AR10]